MTSMHQAIVGGGFRRGPSWLQRLGRSNGLTLGISAVLHGAVFLGFYRVVLREDSPPRQIIIPEARLAPAGGAAGNPSVPPPRLDPRPAPPPLSGSVGSIASAGPTAVSPLQLNELPVLAVNLTGGSGFVVGAPPGTATGPSGSAVLGASGSLLGSGYAAGGRGGSGGLVGPATTFFGAAGNAYRVVYVVDVSASLRIYLSDVKKQLISSIQALTPSQQFQIITNQFDRTAKADAIREFAPNRLVYATEKNKREAVGFVNALRVETGVFDPLGTLRRAHQLQPELIYLLSDGDYPNVADDLLKLVKDLNARHPAKITAISFDPAPRSRGLLEAVTRQTGGFFRLVEFKAGE
ncbi:MAG: hypothetical protein HRF43_18615 [Phycisphaerae bacterium]|jgi:hypothetical protein